MVKNNEYMTLEIIKELFSKLSIKNKLGVMFFILCSLLCFGLGSYFVWLAIKSFINIDTTFHDTFLSIFYMILYSLVGVLCFASSWVLRRVIIYFLDKSLSKKLERKLKRQEQKRARVEKVNMELEKEAKQDKENIIYKKQRSGIFSCRTIFNVILGISLWNMLFGKDE